MLKTAVALKLRTGATLKALTVFAALAASSLFAIGHAPSAQACLIDDDGDCYFHVTGTVTPSNGLNLRASPWGTILDTLPNGYSGNVDCYVRSSDGTFWDWIYDSRIGRSGWVDDAFLFTGGNINSQVDEMHEGNCG